MPAVPVMDIPPVSHETEIRIDALDNEPAWASALELKGFTAFAPVPGQPPADDTTVRIMADKKALYVFFQAWDSEPQRIHTGLGRRDTRFDDDWVGLYLDTAGTAQRAYMFMVNPHGIQVDGTRVAGTDSDNSSWDTQWYSRGRMTDRGYQVELSIPWRSVRHPAHCQQIGLILFRNQARTAEMSSYPELDTDMQGVLVQEALYQGIGDLPRNAGLDLIPSLTFGWTDSGPPEDRWSYQGLSPGITLRYAPDAALTLLGTVNPDFSQVESDASQVDVNRRYALYYEEKRPFFLEGQEWFEHQLGEVVYTRSMVAPRYGARATLEKEGWSVAAIHTLDATPSSSVSEGEGWTEDDLEGYQALETVARVRRAMGDDSYLGLIFSDRTILGTDLANRLGGLDGWLRLSDRTSISGGALGSWTSFSQDDARSDAKGKLSLEYNSTRLYLNAEAKYIGPDFRAENGFMNWADAMGGEAWLRWASYPDKAALKKINVIPANTDIYWYTDGRLRQLSYSPSFNMTFSNAVSSGGGFSLSGEDYDGTWLRYQKPWMWLYGTPTKWLNIWAFAKTGTSPYYDDDPAWTGWVNYASGEITLQPVSQISVSLSGTMEDFREEAFGDGVYRATVGRCKLETFASRYLWARWILDWNTVDILGDDPDRSSNWQLESLLAWERAPNKAIYLGGLMVLDDPVEWQIFAKVSWLMTL